VLKTTSPASEPQRTHSRSRTAEQCLSKPTRPLIFAPHITSADVVLLLLNLVRYESIVVDTPTHRRSAQRQDSKIRKERRCTRSTRFVRFGCTSNSGEWASETERRALWE
ncbi:hypothetical protein AAF712_016859, partial [Marasmius tenuissimus]